MAEEQLDITVLRGRPKREPPTLKKMRAAKVTNPGAINLAYLEGVPDPRRWCESDLCC